MARCRRCRACRRPCRRRTRGRARRTSSHRSAIGPSPRARLLGLTWIGPHEGHPAVAEPHVSDLDRHRDAVDQNDLVAPVELVGLSRIEAQRHEGSRRSRAARAPPGRGVAPDGVIAAFVAQTAQVLEDPQQRHPLAPAARSIRGEETLELLAPRPELRMRLNAALVLEHGLLGPQNLPHNLPRQLQLTADLLDRLSLNKMRPEPPRVCRRLEI